MKLKVKEVFFNNGDVDIIIDGLIEREHFKIILDKFLDVPGVKLLKESSDEFRIACLFATDEFEFVLVYDSDCFVWNYFYSVKRDNHVLLKDLCTSIVEFV